MALSVCIESASFATMKHPNLACSSRVIRSPRVILAQKQKGLKDPF